MIQKHRISTKLGVNQKITVELKQNFDVLEILSLKFSQQEIYTSICSDYGVVCGRVTANNGFGLGNARVSIFIPLSTEDEEDPVISSLYPYKEVTDKDDSNYRYNLLPARQQHGGHAPTGTFPDQSDILSREEVLEVYEKYYKYTVKTNSAGDFMIWGVPVGPQTIHVDVDLSDIGCFSLRPYDLQRLGIGVDGFKNKYSFKSSEDLDSLPQIVSFDKIIEVYPFWGNEDVCEIGITRSDFDLSEKGVNIKPTAYLIGGVFTDNGKNAINKNCTPRKKMGRKCDLTAKSANIEAIRFLPIKDDTGKPFLEYLPIDEDVPDDGGFVLPLEMNMDYIITNEFGENEYTNDFNKGIATSACYRFRFNLNDKGVERARNNADYLVPNIREFHTGTTITNESIDDRSYYFGTDWNGYPPIAVSTNSNYGILYNEGGQYIPKDYFYRFNYNKVYTVSSFHSNYQVNGNFANINELHPSEEEDCGDKLTPPSNFGFKNYTFTLLIADFLLLLDFVIKFVVLQFTNIGIQFLNQVVEALITLGADNSLRETLTRLQINSQTKLSLITYPECQECSDGNETGGTFEINYTGGTCSLYDTVYDDGLVTGYFIEDLTNNNTFLGCGSPGSYLPQNYRRKYVATLSPGDVVLSTAIYGADITNQPLSRYPYPGPNYEIRDFSCGSYSYNGGFFTQSARSEFYNGVFYVVPGTQTPARLSRILSEYYRRKRVGKMFCGGIVNYAFIDNWLSGSLYFLQFKAKKLARLRTATSEKVLKYCRDLVRFVFDQKRFYYRSAPTINGESFIPDNLNKPTTIVDLGPRDEFIKEICIDSKLDPNCSVSRSVGASSYQSLGELLGLAINYRMDVADNNGNLDMFFDNKGFSNGVGISNVLDGDILQLLSINNETGIEEFDLQNPKYLGYQFNILDPEEYPQVFSLNGDGTNWGPLPLTLELSEDGQRIRSCLNEVGRLTEASQKVPFYLWDKKGTGFGSYGIDKNNQSWDYTEVQLKPLQGMTHGYNLTGDVSDQYLLLPMTYTFGGQSISGISQISGTTVEFDVISDIDDHTTYNSQYPGFTYLYVTGGTENEPISGMLYTRFGDSNTWESTPWTNTTFIIKRTQDYYSGNKQILSTPFQFYFGLNEGKTGMDKFIDLFGPKGAFPSAE